MWNTVSHPAVEGVGVLSRSREDLHPQPERYVTVWSGTISAQAQKAEQRPAPEKHWTPDELAKREVRRKYVADKIVAALVTEGSALSIPGTHHPHGPAS